MPAGRKRFRTAFPLFPARRGGPGVGPGRAAACALPSVFLLLISAGSTIASVITVLPGSALRCCWPQLAGRPPLPLPLLRCCPCCPCSPSHHHPSAAAPRLLWPEPELYARRAVFCLPPSLLLLLAAAVASLHRHRSSIYSLLGSVMGGGAALLRGLGVHFSFSGAGVKSGCLGVPDAGANGVLPAACCCWCRSLPLLLWRASQPMLCLACALHDACRCRCHLLPAALGCCCCCTACLPSNGLPPVMCCVQLWRCIRCLAVMSGLFFVALLAALRLPGLPGACSACRCRPSSSLFLILRSSISAGICFLSTDGGRARESVAERISAPRGKQGGE